MELNSMPPENENQKKDAPKSQTLSEIAQLAEKELRANSASFPTKSPSPFGEPEKKEYTPNPELKTLRTFQGDMEETIHKKNESIVSIAVAEQTSKKKEAPELLPKETKDTFLTHGILPLAGLILVLVGAITLGIIYYYKAINNAPVPVTPQTVLISSADKKDVSVGQSPRDDIIQNLISNKTSFAKNAGSILYVRFLSGTTELPASDFFQSIAPTAPPALARSFGGQYMAGIYSYDTNEVFFILSTVDYGQTYSGMLRWESAMANDLSPFFSNIPATYTASSPFQDDSFSNRDVRVIRNSNGDIVLVYGFIDKSTLVITANEKIFQSIASKYINSKLIH